ncbi:hypothetical protein WPS_16630 [Vulcanimicrobium alpinum]|uniref:Fimbrial assembly protein n=1 Tax=Vulcanimicrobium alpinum TaxID=3016050 RepID=A0AAN2CA80_UNVUL|nr:hypothetical protein [Vulcanimicrobium alpinum]BDE06387.1 hypothetical protein WPS_16630 [Vulcanimicrobium alpinum]
MNRVNFLISPLERTLGVAPAPPPARLRGPLAALAGAVVLVCACGGVQGLRLRAAQADGALYAAELARAERDVASVRVLQRDVERLRGVAARIVRVRASGARRASEIAALGNHLPADAWLTSLRVERTVVAVEGRGARLSAVGTAMTSLTSLRPYRSARLLSVHGDPVHAGVVYAIALERRP